MHPATCASRPKPSKDMHRSSRFSSSAAVLHASASAAAAGGRVSTVSAEWRCRSIECGRSGDAAKTSTGGGDGDTGVAPTDRAAVTMAAGRVTKGRGEIKQPAAATAADRTEPESEVLYFTCLSRIDPYRPVSIQRDDWPTSSSSHEASDRGRCGSTHTQSSVARSCAKPFGRTSWRTWRADSPYSPFEASRRHQAGGRGRQARDFFIRRSLLLTTRSQHSNDSLSLGYANAIYTSGLRFHYFALLFGFGSVH